MNLRAPIFDVVLGKLSKEGVTIIAPASRVFVGSFGAILLTFFGVFGRFLWMLA
jgi:hypothetical protein